MRRAPCLPHGILGPIIRERLSFRRKPLPHCNFPLVPIQKLIDGAGRHFPIQISHLLTVHTRLHRCHRPGHDNCCEHPPTTTLSDVICDEPGGETTKSPTSSSPMAIAGTWATHMRKPHTRPMALLISHPHPTTHTKHQQAHQAHPSRHLCK